MQARTSRRPQCARLVELGVVSAHTMGMPVGKVPEIMGLWSDGISEE